MSRLLHPFLLRICKKKCTFAEELKRRTMKKIVILSLLALLFAGCQPSAKQQKVYGRYVPERKDDFAWENEYAAFRMYGPALLSENPSNGVDLWLKSTPALAVDTMYGRELNDHRPYHINYDGNLDCYKVGHAAGCGGMCVVCDNQLYVGGPYSRYEILVQEPERFQFRLEYDSFLVADQIMQASITITAEAGTPFNRADVVLMCPTKIRLPQLYVGGGIFLHDSIDNLLQCNDCQTTFYCEEALSDKQAARMNNEYNGSTSQGRCYVAVHTPGADMITTIDQTALTLRSYDLCDTLTYYFGAGWSRWSNGTQTLEQDEDWIQLIKQVVKKL